MNMFPGSFDSAPNIANWFTINKDGTVRMVSGKVEIGQGINTAFVQIAAEELDIDPDRIEISAGNTKDGLDGGCTAGSQSMQTEGISVRKAASAARMLMLSKASELLQSDVRELNVIDGEIYLNDNSTNLSYWSIAKDIDFNQPVEIYMQPKLPSQRKLAGKSIKRIDLKNKILGTHEFVHDIELDGMLHARVVRPPSVSSRIIKIDIDKINTLKNLKKLVVNGSFIAVIAEREEDAVKLAEQVNKYCKWSTPDKIIEDPLQFIRDTKSPIINSLDKGKIDVLRSDGISTEVSRKFLCHASIGPCCAVAQWKGNTLEVYTHSQAVFAMKRTLASIFNIDESDVDVMHKHGSGCYGHNGADDVVLDAVLVAKELNGTPVRLVWSREDELSWSPLAPGMVTKIDANLADNLMIESFDISIKSPPHVKRPSGENGEYLLAAEHMSNPLNPPNPVDTPLDKGGAADRNSMPLYDIPNLRIQKQIVYDLPWRTSAMRGLGAFVNVYAIETLMDDIASMQEIDPIEFRLKHLSDPRIIELIERVRDISKWTDRSPGLPKGFAFSRYKNSGAYCAMVVEINVDEDIELINAWAVIDAGEVVNADGVKNQIEGGIIQATSCTLIEEVNFDGEIISATDWENYPIIKFKQTPQIHVELIDRPEEPFLGVGEAAHGPTAAAISNALFTAMNIRIKQLPITRERIISSLNT